MKLEDKIYDFIKFKFFIIFILKSLVALESLKLEK